jgi:hypothetical protein
MVVLSGALTIRIAGRCVLRANPALQDGELMLFEPDGTGISAEAPVAALLDRTDLIAALAPGGAPLETFWEGPARFRLRLKRVRGGAELLIETPDGEIRDAHQTPIRAILPMRAWHFSRNRIG